MKISIITVVYNGKEDMRKSFASVLSQKDKNFEYIIIDGGSTDGTLEFLNENSKFIDKFISEPDEGLYFAMNKGKDIATGEFALFMNAGDEFVNDSVMGELEKHLQQSDLLYFGNTIIYYDSTYKVAPKRHHQSVLFPKTFYSKVDYNSKKFKVTAEGDYIYKALNQCKEKHIDVDIIFSRLDGFRVTRYKTMNGIKLMYNEVTGLMKEHSGKVPLSYKLNYPIKSIAKYIAFKVGGLPLVAKLLLSSYKEPKNKYYRD